MGRLMVFLLWPLRFVLQLGLVGLSILAVVIGVRTTKGLHGEARATGDRRAASDDGRVSMPTLLTRRSREANPHNHGLEQTGYARR